MLNTRFAVLLGFLFMAAASRLVPHPPNFTPLAALALFGGACFSDRCAAFLVPFGAMFLSDLVIGWHRGWSWVYGSFALIVCLGFWLRGRRTFARTAAATVTGSVLFFAITNFGVWAMGSLYPRTASGLVTCYVAAVPFFRNTLAGDALCAAVLFSGLALAEKWFPSMREPAPVGTRP